jgi:acetylornithine deacetylase/succinyl-diaminopimelate desuccinylase-like protein
LFSKGGDGIRRLSLFQISQFLPPFFTLQRGDFSMEPKLESYLDSEKSRQLAELQEWLRIPSISTLSAHKKDVQSAAEWLVTNMRQAGLENVTLIQTDTQPMVYADWLHAGDDKPTVLIYGHFDVQPVDPLSLWETPPFEPTVRGDDLYARGASDDKGQTFLHVKAVEALLQTTGTLPVNVKFLVEGEEESGSRAINQYVPQHGEQLAADAVLISDTHIIAPDKPAILYGLRGMWRAEITVTGASRDLHSGSYGGAIHNANQALAEILAALHDAQGRIAVPGFYDDVRELSADERASLARVPYGEQEILADSGAPAIYGEPEYTVVERTGARPTLEINGMWGGFTEEGFKTVIPSKAYAKISCRLVPNQDSVKIGQQVTAYLKELAPPTVTVDVRPYSEGGPAFLTPYDSPAIQAAARAYQQIFGVEPIYTLEGGGIPVVTVFQRVLAAPIVLMGFGLPDDNLHAPNEKFHLPNFYNGIRTSIAFLHEMGAA